jgi:hypothetical protein
MVVLLDYATREQFHIGKYAILFVCIIEGISIISNILKPLGYDINVMALISVLLKKFFKIDNAENVIKKKG